MDTYPEFNNAAEIVEMQINNICDHVSVTSITSGIDFQNMIENCLLEIFSDKSLALTDLCSIAETCRRFQRIVQRIPRRIYFANRERRDVCKVYWRNLISSDECTQKEVEKVLKNFGSTISALLFRDFHSPYLYNLILKYCDDNLNILNIQSSFLPDISSGKFTQLKYLRLEDVYMKPSESPFVELVSLVELKVIRVRNSRAILVNCFPKLERFTFVGAIQNRFDGLLAGAVESSKVLTNFFKRNNTLKAIHFVMDDFNEIAMMFLLRKIADSCKELDVFRINRLYTFILQPLQSLKSLVCLELYEVSCQDLDVFTSLTTLRTLRLNRCRLPKVSTKFSSLVQLTKLDVNQTQSVDVLDVVGIISELVNLEVFSINRRWTQSWIAPFVLDKNDFAKIVDVVKDRTNVLTLTCKTNFVPTYFKDSEKIRLLPLCPNVEH